jgi:hypothetical protein
MLPVHLSRHPLHVTRSLVSTPPCWRQVVEESTTAIRTQGVIVWTRSETLCNHHGIVWLSNHVIWPQLIELCDTLVIHSPHLVECPDHLQTQVITIRRLNSIEVPTTIVITCRSVQSVPIVGMSVVVQTLVIRVQVDDQPHNHEPLIRPVLQKKQAHTPPPKHHQ